MSQCNDIFTDKSIFRYFSCRKIGQFQKTWAHFGKNKTIRPHVTLVRAYECNWLLRFLWRSEFDIDIDRDKFKLKVDRSLETLWQEYGVEQASGDGLLVLTTEGRLNRYLTSAIAPGNSPIRLPCGRMHQSVPIICFFAKTSWFGEAPCKTWTRDTIYGQVKRK